MAKKSAIEKNKRRIKLSDQDFNKRLALKSKLWISKLQLMIDFRRNKARKIKKEWS